MPEIRFTETDKRKLAFFSIKTPLPAILAKQRCKYTIILQLYCRYFAAAGILPWRKQHLRRDPTHTHPPSTKPGRPTACLRTRHYFINN